MNVILCVLCCLVLLSTTAISQEPCATDCDTATAPYTLSSLTVNISASCQIVLHVRTRVCAGIYELDILSANAVGTCLARDIQAEIMAAIKSVVTNNLMNFPPGNVNGTHTWRISRPSCWLVSEAQPSPCSIECCVSYLQVEKRAECNTWSITSETLRSLPRVCPPRLEKHGEEAQSSEQTCAFMCDRLAPAVK